MGFFQRDKTPGEFLRGALKGDLSTKKTNTGNIVGALLAAGITAIAGKTKTDVVQGRAENDKLSDDIGKRLNNARSKYEKR